MDWWLREVDIRNVERIQLRAGDCYRIGESISGMVVHNFAWTRSRSEGAIVALTKESHVIAMFCPHDVSVVFYKRWGGESSEGI